MKVRDATNDDYTQEKPTPHFFVAYSTERLSLLPLISNLSTRPEAKNNCATSLKTCNFGGKRFHGRSSHTRNTQEKSTPHFFVAYSIDRLRPSVCWRPRLLWKRPLHQFVVWRRGRDSRYSSWICFCSFGWKLQAYRWGGGTAFEFCEQLLCNIRRWR